MFAKKHSWLNLFRTKILLLLLLVSMIPLVVSAGILYNRAVWSMKNQTADIAENSIRFETRIADSLIQAAEYFGNQYTEDRTLRRMCSDEETWDYSKTAQKYREMMKVLNRSAALIRSMNLDSGVLSFSLWFPERKLVFDSQTTFYYVDDPENITFLGLNHGRDAKWEVCERLNYFNIHGETAKTIQAGNAITKCYDICSDEGDLTGILAVFVKSELFENYYNEIQKGLSGNTIVTDTFDNILIASDENLAEAFSRHELFGRTTSEWNDVQLDGKEFILVSGALNNLDAIIYILIETDVVLNHIRRLYRWFSIILAVTAGVILLLALFFHNYIYQPVRVLKEYMGKVTQGSLGIKIRENRNDDIQELYDSFNNMTSQLEVLVHQVAEERSLYEDAELRLLQEQINPHFLYNALNSIYSIAKIYKVPEIEDISMALSRYFRTSLSNGKNIVPMKEALNIAESYLIIQKIRFEDKLHYIMHIEEGLSQVAVPKLLFQPLVENAVYHGLEKVNRKGEIELNVKKIDSLILITVWDNGIGMDEEQLNAVRKALENAGDHEKYYALRNLARQLKLMYQGKAGIKIESIYGEGTTVSIYLPFNTNLLEDDHVHNPDCR